jgi:hypothetical protein
LSRDGLSARAIADRLATEGLAQGPGVYRSVARGAASGSAPPPPSPKAPPPAKASSAPSPAPERGAAGTALPDPSPDAAAELEELLHLAAGAQVDPGRAADDAIARLAAANTLFTRRLDDEMRAENPDIKLLDRLTNLMVLTTRELTKQRPPPAIDPEQDPTNLAARDALRARLATLVESAEAAGAASP